MKIAEIFYSIQGEIDVGKPCVFIRFSGCNLIKEGKGCKFCDSLYAEQGVEMSVDELIKKVESYGCKNIVITGGESLLQKEELVKLLDSLQIKKEYNISIETNGTLYDADVFWYCDSINCSPKRQIIDIKILKELKNWFANFKFVYESKDDKWWEKIIEEVGISDKNVWIMPEGKTKEEQEEKMEEVIEYCKEKGYNFTPRMHVLVYGNRRGV